MFVNYELTSYYKLWMQERAKRVMAQPAKKVDCKQTIILSKVYYNVNVFIKMTVCFKILSLVCILTPFPSHDNL